MSTIFYIFKQRMNQELNNIVRKIERQTGIPFTEWKNDRALAKISILVHVVDSNGDKIFNAEDIFDDFDKKQRHLIYNMEEELKIANIGLLAINDIKSKFKKK